MSDAATTATAPARRPHLLLADDDYEMRKLLRWSLEHAGYRVTECPDGHTLLKKLEAETGGGDGERYDLIVTDVRMPGVTGTEALRQGWLRGDWPPVILITAFPDPELRERALRLGAQAVLAKPFDVDLLVALAGRILPARSLARADDAQGAAPPTPAEPRLPFPVEITCRHGSLAAPLRDYIHEAAARFADCGGQIRDLSVVVDETRPDEHRRRQFRVSLRVRSDAGNIAVSLDADRAGAHPNPYLTLHAAFSTAWHRLQRRLERRANGKPAPAGARVRRAREQLASAAAGPFAPLRKE
ncbi:MAG: response regulator [Candidatus Latescibacteria bacterium]|nr:response regulator [Candidatus Latescibacterota bacterium]MCB9516127.1 response regulator [Candidatus Latescibacterota bacterium]